MQNCPEGILLLFLSISTLIRTSMFAEMNPTCPKLIGRRLFELQAHLGENEGPGGPCTRSNCGFRRRMLSLESSPMCNRAHEKLLKRQYLTMEHLFSRLTTLNRSIAIGGYWTIPNFLWNPYTNDRCDLNKVDLCRSEIRNDPDDVHLACFENEFQLLTWSQQIKSSVKTYFQRIIPNRHIVFDEFLPYPNVFNVTILQFEQYNVCKKPNPIVCHRRMNLNENRQCSFYLCHTTKSEDIWNLTFLYEPTKTRFNMLMMCHVLTNEKIKEYQTVLGDKICHFLTPQTNFLLCDK